jgi:hypothetical protein
MLRENLALLCTICKEVQASQSMIGCFFLILPFDPAAAFRPENQCACMQINERDRLLTTARLYQEQGTLLRSTAFPA